MGTKDSRGQGPVELSAVFRVTRAMGCDHGQCVSKLARGLPESWEESFLPLTHPGHHILGDLGEGHFHLALVVPYLYGVSSQL